MKNIEALAAIRDANVQAQAKMDGVILPTDEDIEARKTSKVIV